MSSRFFFTFDLAPPSTHRTTKEPAATFDSPKSEDPDAVCRGEDGGRPARQRESRSVEPSGHVSARAESKPETRSGEPLSRSPADDAHEDDLSAGGPRPDNRPAVATGRRQDEVGELPWRPLRRGPDSGGGNRRWGSRSGRRRKRSTYVVVLSPHDEKSEDADGAEPQDQDESFELRLGHAQRW